MRLVTSEQMRRLDARTIALGTPSIDLMERAGRGVAEALHRGHGPACKRGVLVVAGAGNNGGDGFVIARVLASKGHRVQVALLGRPDRLKGDAKTNFERWRRRRGRVVELADEEGRQRFHTALAACGVVVDCVFGTGLARPVEGAAADLVEAVNARPAKRGRRATVAAVDLPSGLDGDRGEPLGVAIRADVTFTLGATKLGLVLPCARPWVGVLEQVEIGLAKEAFDDEAPLAEASTPDVVRALLPARDETGHKGSHGHVLLVAGASGTSGAAVLAGRAALRGGAGLATVACPADVARIVAASQPELMTSVIERFSAAEWADRLVGKKALAVGPGLGTSREASRTVRWLVTRAALPMVVDADGLNVLADHLDTVRRAQAPVVLTPHPGEMARLCGATTADVQRDRRRCALELAQRTGAIVVLKGSGTLVAAPDGRLGVNRSGGPILGTAGTGDVLAGFVGSLLAQGLDAFDAARLGVHLHGRAGDRLAERLGSAGLLARELADELPLAREELRRGG